MDKNSSEYRHYQEYLLSPKWKQKRSKKLKQAGYKCQKCGSVGKLECHHKTYERLYKERLADLEILCEACHVEADKVRKFEAGMKTYMIKKYGERWTKFFSEGQAALEFNKWLGEK